MSFGVGVGDIVTVTKLVAGLRRRFLDAPEQYRGIRDDLKLLSITLLDVEVILPQCELSDDRAKHYLEAHKDSVKALEEMEGKLAKFLDMGSGGTTWRSKARDIWKRLQWDDQYIIQQRERLGSIRESFDFFLQIVNYNVNLEIKASIDEIKERETDREQRETKRAILDWLSVWDHSSQQRDVIAKRTFATGKWLLESSEFQSWLDKPSTCLLCTGGPGTGKTIISSTMIEHLQTKQRQEGDTGLAFFYFNYQSHHDHTDYVIIGSLVRQLLETSEVIPGQLLDRYKQSTSSPTLDELKEFFIIAAQTYGRTYVVLDALDEYFNQDPERFERLLRIVLNFQQPTGLRLLSACRPISKITSMFSNCSIIEISAHEDDVALYLDHRMPELLLGKIVEFPELQESVKAAIMGVINGMFLLARLHMDSLRGEMRKKDIIQALEHLPRGLNGLKVTYDQAMERINRQGPGPRGLANNILKWITHAQRPLSVAELQQILALDPGETILDMDSCPSVEAIDSLCAGLVIIDSATQIVRLVHETTKAYFESNDLFSDAHTELLELCTTYLALDQFPVHPNEYERGWHIGPTGLTRKLWREKSIAQRFPFYIYAWRNWHFHAKLARKIPEQTFEFLSNQEKMPVYEKWGEHETHILGVHLAAKYGLNDLLVALVKRGQSPEAKTSLGVTPLLYAIQGGNSKTVDMLLFQYNADPNVEAHGYNASSYAFDSLNDSPEPDQRDPIQSRRSICRMLLEHPLIVPTVVNAIHCERCAYTDDGGRGLLIMHEKLVFDRKMLGHFPLNVLLCRLIERGYEAQVIEFVKRHYTSIDEEGDGLGEPILYQMVYRNQTEHVDNLITRHGANKYWRDDRSRTLCHIAAVTASVEVFDLLVTKHGLDPTARDNFPWTPFQLVLRHVHMGPDHKDWLISMSRIIYRHPGVNVDEPYTNSHTALMLTVLFQNEKHRRGVEYARSLPRKIPYYWEAYYSLAKVSVTEYNANISTQDAHGNCAIHLALRSPMCKNSSAFVRDLLCHQEMIISDDFLSSARKFFEGEWTERNRALFEKHNIKDLSQEYKVALDMLEEIATRQRVSGITLVDLSKDQPAHKARSLALPPFPDTDVAMNSREQHWTWEFYIPKIW